MILLDSIIDVVGGSLINSPTISHFNNISSNLNDISYGDIFITKDSSLIQEAIDLGAYGVICNKDSFVEQFLSSDIAIILVENSHEALLSLIRFNLSSSSLKIILTTKVAISILKKGISQKVLDIDSKNIEKISKKLLNLSNQALVLSSDSELLNFIYPSYTHLKDSEIDCEINNSSIFNSRLLYNNLLYDEIKVPYLFKDDLVEAIKIVDYLELSDVDFSDFKLHSNFHPIFINSRFEYISYGKSSIVLIVESDTNLVNIGLDYFKTQFSWAKRRVVLPLGSSESADFYYSDIESIKNYLMTQEFNFVYIKIDNILEFKDTFFSEKSLENSLF